MPHFGAAAICDALNSDEFARAFTALGKLRRSRTDLVLGRAGALILTGELARSTMDCDVLYSDPDMGRLLDDIRAVANELHISAGWLNGSIQSYLDILPTNYRTRLRTLPTSGNLYISVLHRQDAIVMKLFAGRPRDLEDVAVLGPTTADIDFAQRELPRLRRIDERRARNMETALDQFRNAIR